MSATLKWRHLPRCCSAEKTTGIQGVCDGDQGSRPLHQVASSLNNRIIFGPESLIKRGFQPIGSVSRIVAGPASPIRYELTTIGASAVPRSAILTLLDRRMFSSRSTNAGDSRLCSRHGEDSFKAKRLRLPPQNARPRLGIPLRSASSTLLRFFGFAASEGCGKLPNCRNHSGLLLERLQIGRLAP